MGWRGGSMVFEELSSRRCDVLGVSCPVLLSLRLGMSARLAQATVWHARENGTPFLRKLPQLFLGRASSRKVLAMIKLTYDFKRLGMMG